MKFVVFALCALVVAATPVPWENCLSNSPIVVNSLDATPWPPVEGQNITILGNVSLVGETVSGGSYSLTASVDGIPIVDKTGDVCEILQKLGMTCPVSPGTFVKKMSEAIPQIGFGVEISAKLTATDQNGNNILCGTIDVNVSSLARPAINNRIIDLVNSRPDNTWKAGKNKFFESWSLDQARKIMGVKKTGARAPRISYPNELKVGLPSQFDARTQWPNLIGPILNQGECGSCWAFGSATVVSDRIAIVNGTYVALAPLDLVTCDAFDSGCQGGDPTSALQYAQSDGLVTEACYPYLTSEGGPIPTCAPQDQPCLNFVNTPSCSQSCANSQGWSSSKHFVSSVYGLNSVSDMMTDLVKNGPFEAAFTVYEDFLSYKSGVYQYTSGQMLGGHAVRVIGYGTESGVDYWMVANSWTNSWGDNGYFKIRRGTDECGFEDDCVTALP